MRLGVGRFSMVEIDNVGVVEVVCWSIVGSVLVSFVE